MLTAVLRKVPAPRDQGEADRKKERNRDRKQSMKERE